MRVLTSILALALAAPAGAQESCRRRPPPPSSNEAIPAPPPPAAGAAGRAGSHASRATAAGRAPASPRRAGTIGEAPVAPAGSQAAPLHPDEASSHWRYSLATGVTGKFGGMQLTNARENPGVLLYFGGAGGRPLDGGLRPGGAAPPAACSRAARPRSTCRRTARSRRAYMIGRREFRFVIGRLRDRAATRRSRSRRSRSSGRCRASRARCRSPRTRCGSTTSCRPSRRRGSTTTAARTSRTARPWATESDRPAAASAGRLRYTVLLPPSVLLSLQGDLVKMWQKADLLLAVEGSLGYQVLAAVRRVQRRGPLEQLHPAGARRRGRPRARREIMLLGVASLVF